jgi:hypothetical protein
MEKMEGRDGSEILPTFSSGREDGATKLLAARGFAQGESGGLLASCRRRFIIRLARMVGFVRYPASSRDGTAPEFFRITALSALIGASLVWGVVHSAS